jgi:DNA-binding response OmpR family regulator
VPAAPLHIEHVEIRPSEYQVLIDQRRARLTVREFQIFYALAQRQDRVVRRHELYAVIWGGPMAYRDRSVDVFVRKVRRKLAEVSPEWTYIHTHFGIGYRMSVERAQPEDALEPDAPVEPDVPAPDESAGAAESDGADS